MSGKNTKGYIFPNGDGSLYSTEFDLESNFGVVTVVGLQEGDSVCVEVYSGNECDGVWSEFAPTCCGQMCICYPQNQIFLALPAKYRLFFSNNRDLHLTDSSHFENVEAFYKVVKSDVDLTSVFNTGDCGMSGCTPPDVYVSSAIVADPTGFNLIRTDGEVIPMPLVAENGIDIDGNRFSVNIEEICSSLIADDVCMDAIQARIDTDTFGTISISGASGTDSSGLEYTAGTPLITMPNGDNLAIPTAEQTLVDQCYDLPTLPSTGICNVTKIALVEDTDGCQKLFKYEDSDTIIVTSSHNEHPTPLFPADSGGYSWPADLAGGTGGNPYTAGELVQAVADNTVDETRLVGNNSMIEYNVPADCPKCFNIDFRATIEQNDPTLSKLALFYRLTFPDGTVRWSSLPDGTVTGFGSATNYESRLTGDFNVCVGMAGNLKVEIFAAQRSGPPGAVGLFIGQSDGGEPASRATQRI